MRKILSFFLILLTMNVYSGGIKRVTGVELLLPDGNMVKCCISSEKEIKLTNGKYNYFVKVLYDENGKPLDIFVVKSEKNKPDTEHESFDIKLVRFLGTSNKITGIPGFEKINKADIDGDRCCLNCNGWIVCGCAVECDGKTCCVNPCCGIF